MTIFTVFGKRVTDTSLEDGAEKVLIGDDLPKPVVENDQKLAAKDGIVTILDVQPVQRGSQYVVRLALHLMVLCLFCSLILIGVRCFFLPVLRVDSGLERSALHESNSASASHLMDSPKMDQVKYSGNSNSNVNNNTDLVAVQALNNAERSISSAIPSKLGDSGSKAAPVEPGNSLSTDKTEDFWGIIHQTDIRVVNGEILLQFDQIIRLEDPDSKSQQPGQLANESESSDEDSESDSETNASDSDFEHERFVKHRGNRGSGSHCHGRRSHSNLEQELHATASPLANLKKEAKAAAVAVGNWFSEQFKNVGKLFSR